MKVIDDKITVKALELMEIDDGNIGEVSLS